MNYLQQNGYRQKSSLLPLNGTGIKDEAKLLVFKPFYRLDKSRSLNNLSNVGLGLAITKEIIIDHNGIISLQESKSLVNY